MLPTPTPIEQSPSPRLRPDLRISHAAGALAFHVLEDGIAGKCFELGAREAHCLLACDGQRTIGEILATQPQVVGLPPLTGTDFQQLINWAMGKQLLLDHSDQAVGRQQATYRAQARSAWIKWTNPISISISLGSPARLLNVLAPKLDWIFDVRWFPLAGMAVIYSLFCWYEHAEKFSSHVVAIWADQQWLPLVVVWLWIKLVHELAHGVVARRYGSQVCDAGIYLILFLPLAYVDVSNSARLPNRWKRIHIAAAGMYVEIVLAAVAMIIWAWTTNVMLASWMHAIVISAGVSTLVFNANPLMRFDGYYILADLLGIPNLATRGKQWVGSMVKRWCLGIHATPLMLPGYKRVIVAIYGIAALIWKIMLQVTLVIGAAALFYGLGVLIAALAILHYAMEPMMQLMRFVRNERPWAKWKPVNVVISMGVAGATAWLLTSILTGPVYLNAPAVVRYPAEKLVRVAAEGFVDSIDVHHGQKVVAGQRLAVLRNPNLLLQVQALELQLEQSEHHARLAREQADWSEFENCLRAAEGLRAQLSERRSEAENLELRAPCAGEVWHPELEQLLGQYIKRGTALMTIDDGQKELAISISQDDMAGASAWTDVEVQVLFPNLPMTRGKLVRVQPNASLSVPAPALARTFGGPLLVQPVASNDRAKPKFVHLNVGTDQTTDELMLLVPRVTGIVEIPAQFQQQLPIGQTGSVFLPAHQQSLANYIVQQTRRWLNGHLENMRHSIR
jgi:putative peptide zinc metalloprotease protein